MGKNKLPSESANSHRHSHYSISKYLLLVALSIINILRPTNGQTELTESTFNQVDGKDVFLDHIVASSGKEETFEARVQFTQQLYVDVSGYGTVRMLTYKANHTDIQPNGQPKLVLIKETACNIYSSKICWVWNSNPVGPDAFEVILVKLIVTASGSQGADTFKFKLVRSEVVVLPSVLRAYLDLQNVNSVDFQVDLRRLDSSVPQKDGKIQFFAMRNWGSQLTAATFLRMYIKKGTEKVTSENAVMRSSNTIGMGTVITLIPSDEDFCWKRDCVYSVHLDVQDIGFIDFVTEIFDRKTRMEIGETVFLIDQLRENDNATYEIVHTGSSVPKPDEEYMWRFNIYPVEGDADVSINADSLPVTYNDYYIHSNLNSVEDILLNTKQLAAINKVGNKFFVYMNATKQSTFMMRLNRWGINDTPYLIPEEPVTSELTSGQITNYRLNLAVTVPEKFEVGIRIKVASGNPNLYVMDCLETNLNCTLTLDDIKNAKSLAKSDTRFFRYSSNVVGDDYLDLKFTCIPQVDRFKDFSFKADPSAANLYSSKSCVFAVAVVGEPSVASQLSRYTITLTGSGPTNVLTVGEYRRFRIEKNMVVYFALELPLESIIGANNTAAANNKYYMRFWFLIVSGDCDIYISRTNPKPSQQDHDKKFTVDNVNDQLHASQKVADFEAIASELQGHYFIAVKAREKMFGRMSVTVQSTPLQDVINMPERELEWGQSIIERIEAREDERHLYFFHVDVPENQKLVQIALQLVPLKGLFFYCVSNKVQRIKTLTDCQWTPDPDTFTIIMRDTDEGFTRKGRYSVAVFPELPTIDDSGNPIPAPASPDLYTYSLGLGAQSTFTEILEGMPYKLPYLNGVPRLLRVAASEEALYIMLTSNDEQVVLEISAEKDLLRSDLHDDSEQPASAPHITLRGQFSGTVFSPEKMKAWCKYQSEATGSQGGQSGCYLYMKLWPSDRVVHDYTISAFTKSSANYLTEGSVTVLPAPVKHKTFLQHQPLSGTKGLYFNVFCEPYRMKVFLTVRELDDLNSRTNSGRVDSFVVNDLNTNVIFVDASVLTLYKRPYITVELENQDYTTNPGVFNGEDFDLKERIYIQISNGISRLTHMVPIEESNAKKGFMKYYKFTKRSDSIGMIYLQVKSGEVDLYALKGDKKVPDLNSYDFKSVTVKGDELMLPSDNSTQTYNDNYIIGVYAREDSKYQILGSKSSDFLYMQITPGELVVKDINPTTYLLLSFYNRNNKPFQIGVTGKSGGVTVTYRSYDELTNLDFLKEEPNPKRDPSTTTKLKDVVERISITPTKGKENLNQYLIQVQASVATQVGIFVLFEETILKVPDGLVLTETLKPNQCQVYEMFYTDQAFADQTIRFDTLTGSTRLSVFGGYIKDKPDYEKQFNQPTTYKFKLADAMIERNLTVSTFPVFREIFLKACGVASQPSTITVAGASSNRKIVEIHAGERVTLSSDSNAGASVYYFKFNSAVQNITVTFDLPESSFEGKASDINALESVLSIGAPERPEDWWKAEKELYKIKPISHTTNQIKTSRGLLVNYVYQGGKSDGYIVFTKQAGEAKQFNLTFQLIVNNVRPISARGQTAEHIAAGTTSRLELIKPPQSEIKLSLSNCKGLTRVEVIENFADAGSQPTTKVYTLGNSFDMKDPTRANSMAEAHLTIKGESVFITAQNLKSDQPSLLVITPQIITGKDSLSIHDFFSHYEGAQETDAGKSQSTIELVSTQADDEHFSVVVQPLLPSAGFELRAAEFAELSIEYTLFVGDFVLSSQMLPSSCPAEVDTGISRVEEDYIERTAEKTHRLKNGKYDSAPSPVVLSAIPYPKKASRPLKAILQTRLTFRGPYSGAEDDDATIILKRHFVVQASGGALLPTASKLGIMIGVVVVLIIIGIIGYIIVSRCKISSSKVSKTSEMGHVAVQDTGSNSANSHEDSDGMRSPNLTQPEDISLKSGNTVGGTGRGGQSLDDTL